MKRQSIRILLSACVFAFTGISCAPDAQPESPANSAPSQSPVVAIVLGKQVLDRDLEPPQIFSAYLKGGGKDTEAQRAETRNGALLRVIWDPLRARFVAENNAALSEAEIELLQKRFAAFEIDRSEIAESRKKLADELQAMRKEADAPETAPARREELIAVIAQANAVFEASAPEGQQRRAAEWFGGNYKFQQALYKKYGGRVIWQQGGPEAPDAMHLWLKDCAARGDFSIVSSSDAANFWARFPGPGARFSFELDNPDEVFESIEKYIELNEQAESRQAK